MVGKPAEPVSFAVEPGASIMAVTFGIDRVDPKYWGGWDGELADCELDSRRIAQRMTEMDVPFIRLTTEQVSKQAVRAAIKMAVDILPEGGRLLIHNSGHGGQTVDASGDEADGKDEYLVLPRETWPDDEIFEDLKSIKKHLYIFWVCDTCNSGTMGREMNAMVFKPEAKDYSDLTVEVILLAGCNEGFSSMSTGHGGAATIGFLKTGLAGKTVTEICVEAAENASSWQQMVMTEYNVSDTFRNMVFFGEDRQSRMSGFFDQYESGQISISELKESCLMHDSVREMERLKTKGNAR